MHPHHGRVATNRGPPWSQLIPAASWNPHNSPARGAGGGVGRHRDVLYGRGPERLVGLLVVRSWGWNPGLGVGWRSAGTKHGAPALRTSETQQRPASEQQAGCPAGGAGHALRHTRAWLPQQRRQHHAPVVCQSPQRLQPQGL